MLAYPVQTECSIRVPFQEIRFGTVFQPPPTPLAKKINYGTDQQFFMPDTFSV